MRGHTRTKWKMRYCAYGRAGSEIEMAGHCGLSFTPAVLINHKTCVSPLLKPHSLNAAKSQKAPLLDIVAAAYHLGCSERFVRRLVQERRIPYVKLGGTKVRFM